MKYKPGDKVIIISVPERAKVFGVEPGMRATVQTIKHEESRVYVEDVGLTLIKLDQPPGFEFWWLENDLGIAQ